MQLYESPVYKTQDTSVGGSFTVDKTVGQNLMFRLKTDASDHVIGSPRLINPDGIIVTDNARFDDIGLVWTITVPMAEVCMFIYMLFSCPH